MPRSIQRAPLPTPRGCSSKIQPTRSRTPPTESPSRRRWNCSSARRAATAARNGESIQPPVGGEKVAVHIKSIWQRPFCRLLHFERAFARPPRRPQPKLLIVAPMSGHYPTLLRGTVETFLPNHDVYITEWVDARMVPLVGWPLRSRRLHRLHHLDARTARRRRACDCRMPAFGAGAGGGCADGGRQRSRCAALDGADGRADRHARSIPTRSTSWPSGAGSTGSAITSSPKCRSRIRA